MTLGEKLQLLRRSRGLSQEQLAAELDVSRQAVSKWECGDAVPDLDKLRAICAYFNVTTDYLIWEERGDAPRTSAQRPDYTARRERIRAFVHRNGHWGGYLVALIGAVNLIDSLLSLLALHAFQKSAESGMALDGVDVTVSGVGTMVFNAYLPYLLLYAALTVGGLLLARRLKRKEEEDDDL